MKLSDFLNERLIDTMGIEKILAKEIYDYFYSVLNEVEDLYEIRLNKPLYDEMKGKNYVTKTIINKLKKVFPDKDFSKMAIMVLPEIMFPKDVIELEDLRSNETKRNKVISSLRRNGIAHSFFMDFSIGHLTKGAKEGISTNFIPRRQYRKMNLKNISPEANVQMKKEINQFLGKFSDSEPTFLIQFKIPCIIRAIDFVTEKYAIQEFLAHECTHMFQGLYNAKLAGREDKFYNPKKLSKEKRVLDPALLSHKEIQFLEALYGKKLQKTTVPKYSQEQIAGMTYLNKKAEVGAWARNLYEDLIKWQKSKREKITPQNFIDIAKTSLSWNQMKNGMSPENFKYALKIVYQDFFDEPENKS